MALNSTNCPPLVGKIYSVGEAYAESERYELDFKTNVVDNPSILKKIKKELNYNNLHFVTGILSKGDPSFFLNAIFLLDNETGKLRLDLMIRVPEMIEGKLIEMKPFNVDFLTKDGKIVGLNSARSQVEFQNYLDPDWKNHKWAEIDCDRVKVKSDEPLVDSVRITLFVDILQVKMATRCDVPTLLTLKNYRHPIRRFQPQHFPDVVISCGGKDYPAHRGVLSVNSPIFQKMFETPLSEAKEGRVVINDLDEVTLKLLLNWMYSGTFLASSSEMEECIKLYQVAHKYCVDLLKCQLRKIMIFQTGTENALKMFVLGKIYDDPEILEKAKGIIKRNKNRIFGDTEVVKKFATDHPNLLGELLKL